MKCPICESEGTLHNVVLPVSVRPLPDVLIDVQVPFQECSACGEEITRAGDMQNVERIIQQAKLKWLVENIDRRESLPAVIKELRETHGLSQSDFSDLIGATGNSISKYENGVITPSSIAKKMLTLIALHPEVIDTLRDMAPKPVVREYSFSISTAMSAAGNFFGIREEPARLAVAHLEEFAKLGPSRLASSSTDCTMLTKYVTEKEVDDFVLLISGDSDEGITSLSDKGLPRTLPGFFNKAPATC